MPPEPLPPEIAAETVTVTLPVRKEALMPAGVQ
jgi:hypothetical protein